MLVVLGIIAVLALGGIIYIFFSKKSSKILKLAALIALILSGLTLGVCGTVLVLGGTSHEADPYAFPLETASAAPKPNSGVSQLIVYLVLLVAVFGIIIFLGIRDQKKNNTAAGSAEKENKPDFSSDDF
ncbi:MAG: hypothetical protein FWD78_14165 [Treponema sp.]|nr:hypothetical protein [Treponema sp.]